MRKLKLLIQIRSGGKGIRREGKGSKKEDDEGCGRCRMARSQIFGGVGDDVNGLYPRVAAACAMVWLIHHHSKLGWSSERCWCW